MTCLTGWPLMPPLALIALTQMATPSANVLIGAPPGPEWVRMLRMTIGFRWAGATGAPGVGAAGAGWRGAGAPALPPPAGPAGDWPAAAAPGDALAPDGPALDGEPELPAA